MADLEPTRHAILKSVEALSPDEAVSSHVFLNGRPHQEPELTDLMRWSRVFPAYLPSKVEPHRLLIQVSGRRADEAENFSRRQGFGGNAILYCRSPVMRGGELEQVCEQARVGPDRPA